MDGRHATLDLRGNSWSARTEAAGSPACARVLLPPHEGVEGHSVPGAFSGGLCGRVAETERRVKQKPGGALPGAAAALGPELKQGKARRLEVIAWLPAMARVTRVTLHSEACLLGSPGAGCPAAFGSGTSTGMLPPAWVSGAGPARRGGAGLPGGSEAERCGTETPDDETKTYKRYRTTMGPRTQGTETGALGPGHVGRRCVSGLRRVGGTAGGSTRLSSHPHFRLRLEEKCRVGVAQSETRPRASVGQWSLLSLAPPCAAGLGGQRLLFSDEVELARGMGGGSRGPPLTICECPMNSSRMLQGAEVTKGEEVTAY